MSFSLTTLNNYKIQVTKNSKRVLPPIPRMASHLPPALSKLPSGCQELDLFLEGGLAPGSVNEWGVPFGLGGRGVILDYLASATQGTRGRDGDRAPVWCLWVYSRPSMTVYPPAWCAQGVVLPRVRFAYAPRPVAQLRPIFLESFFKVIVLDAPRFFSEEDCAFVSRQARLNQQTVIILRDHLLTSTQSSIWTKLRVNCWRDLASERHYVRVLRGLSPRQLAFQRQSKVLGN